jgi:hypothetical protein
VYKGASATKKEYKMTYLTAKYIRAAAGKDPRIDPEIEWDEFGKAIVWLNYGYTWNARDNDRSVESFIIAAHNVDEAPRDTVAYWKEKVALIEEIAA